MTDRKRRKLADALARLSASVGDIRALGDEISDIVKTDDERRPLPLRVIAPPASQKPVATTKSAMATVGGNKSLMSLVAASALEEVQQSDEDVQNNWRESLTQLAKELAVSDPEAHDRCTRLMRRYDSLAGTVSLYEAKLRQQSNDVVMTEKVQTRLEQEESAWEEALEEREVRVSELQVQLRELQHAGEDEEEQKDDEEADVVIESEVAALENQGLREALALRMEEKRDIEAAIQSLRRKKRRRDISKEVATQDRDQNRDQDSALRDELEQLRAEKDELQAAIFSMEAEQDEAEAAQQDVSALKDALEESKTQRQRVQDELDRQRHLLTRLKTKMKDMVDVQLMAARDTNPPTISEELVILHLLYEHAGEMDMNELKQASTALLATYGKTTSSAAVLRAIYSLVGSLAVHIDRSIGNGVVTSLLV